MSERNTLLKASQFLKMHGLSANQSTIKQLASLVGNGGSESNFNFDVKNSVTLDDLPFVFYNGTLVVNDEGGFQVFETPVYLGYEYDKDYDGSGYGSGSGYEYYDEYYFWAFTELLFDRSCCTDDIEVVVTGDTEWWIDFSENNTITVPGNVSNVAIPMQLDFTKVKDFPSLIELTFTATACGVTRSRTIVYGLLFNDDYYSGSGSGIFSGSGTVGVCPEFLSAGVRIDGDANLLIFNPTDQEWIVSGGLLPLDGVNILTGSGSGSGSGSEIGAVIVGETAFGNIAVPPGTTAINLVAYDSNNEYVLTLKIDIDKCTYYYQGERFLPPGDPASEIILDTDVPVIGQTLNLEFNLDSKVSGNLMNVGDATIHVTNAKIFGDMPFISDLYLNGVWNYLGSFSGYEHWQFVVSDGLVEGYMFVSGGAISFRTNDAFAGGNFSVYDSMSYLDLG